MNSTKLSPYLKTTEALIHKKTHISHYHSLVSAYETNEVSVNDLVEELHELLQKAKETGESLVANGQSGYMFFVVHPSGTVDLCVRCESFEFLQEENDNPYCYKQTKFKGQLLACGLEKGHDGDCDFNIANPIPNKE